MTVAGERRKTRSAKARQRDRLVDFMVDALRSAGCRILHGFQPTGSRFRVSFETPTGERIGVAAHVFPATFTYAEPSGTHDYTFPYGSEDLAKSELRQDPCGLYVTLCLGIELEFGVLVSFDPALVASSEPRGPCFVAHSDIVSVRMNGWSAWEWEPEEGPIHVLIGLQQHLLLDAIRFESIALGLDQGHRQLLAEQFFSDRARAPSR